jgi:hypothetical protein
LPTNQTTTITTSSSGGSNYKRACWQAALSTGQLQPHPAEAFSTASGLYCMKFKCMPCTTGVQRNIPGLTSYCFYVFQLIHGNSSTGCKPRGASSIAMLSWWLLLLLLMVLLWLHV